MNLRALKQLSMKEFKGKKTTLILQCTINYLMSL